VSKLDNDFFEKVLCFKALSDSTYLASIADFVNPNYFKDKNIGTIFKIITAFYEKRNKLPTNTELKSYLTTDELKESYKTVIESLRSIDKNLDKDELYENTERFLKEKAVYHTMLEVAGDIASGEIDTSSILSKIEKSCSINLITDKGLDLYGDVDKIIEDLQNVQHSIPSKWPWLDDLLNGGFLRDGRSLYIFAGESNIGKSIFLGNIAANIANQGKTVLLITLEMSELLYARRICSNITKIAINSLSTSTGTLKTMLTENRDDTNGRILIKEFPPSTITPSYLKGYIKKITDTGIRIDAIVLDYLNLMHSTVGNNSYERIKYIAEQVRAMSYTFSCPIISATQINRSGFNTENPDMTTISESIGLCATADCITSIFQNDEDRELGVIRLGMMKNRYGARGTTQAMRIDYSTLSILQSDEDPVMSDEYNDNTFKILTSLSEM
jgi:replicative DNA helicase